MSEELKEKLAKDVDQASWEMLEDHHKRGAVFLVSGADLVEVATAAALDNASQIKILLDEQKLVKVDEPLREKFSAEPKAKNFRFIIVQPYVFIKVIGQ